MGAWLQRKGRLHPESGDVVGMPGSRGMGDQLHLSDTLTSLHSPSQESALD